MRAVSAYSKTAPVFGSGGLVVILVLLCGRFSGAIASPSATILYVSPVGNDNWSGRFAVPKSGTDGPFATVRHARDVVRQMAAAGRIAGPVTIKIRGGEYFLNEPLVFESRDSGSEKAPITYEAYPGDSLPVLSAGTRILGWRHLDRALPGLPAVASGRIWEASIPKGWVPEELSINGTSEPRAGDPPTTNWREWNKGNAINQDTLVLPDGMRGLFDRDVDLDIRVAAPANVVMPVDPVASVPNAIRLPRPLLRPKQEYYFRLENLARGLLKEGNWLVDTRAGVIYLWPPRGVDPNNAKIVAARLNNAIELRGEQDSNEKVKFLRFDGIVISDVNRTRLSEPPPPGHRIAPFDSYVTSDAAILVNGSSDCSFTHCRIVNVAGNGLVLSVDASRIRVTDNTIEHCGANGISLLGYNPGTRHDNHDNLIANNKIAHSGVTYWHTAGIRLAMVGDAVIQDNEIAYSPLAGIMVGGQAAEAFRSSRRNKDAFRWNEIADAPLTVEGVARFVPGNVRIENNRIHDVMIIAQDAGGINLWSMHDCVIKGNIIYRGFEDFSWGIYLDHNTLNTTVTNNLIYQWPLAVPNEYGSGLLMNESANDRIVNNIFILGSKFFRFGDDLGGNVVERNIVQFGPEIDSSKRFPSWFQGPVERLGGPTRIDRNLYWSLGGPEVINNWLGQWRAQGWDRHSVVADPMFEDASRHDFRLRKGSPAGEIGFVSFIR